MDSSIQEFSKIESDSFFQQKLHSLFGIEEKISLKTPYGQTLRFFPRDIVTNSKGIGLVSQRLIQQYPDWLIQDIEHLLMEKYGLLWVVWIPIFWKNTPEKLQKYMSFQDDETVCIKTEQELIHPRYKETLRNYLKSQGLKLSI